MYLFLLQQLQIIQLKRRENGELKRNKIKNLPNLKYRLSLEPKKAKDGDLVH
jgi:hypothetical protein